MIYPLYIKISYNDKHMDSCKGKGRCGLGAVALLANEDVLSHRHQINPTPTGLISQAIFFVNFLIKK